MGELEEHEAAALHAVVPDAGRERVIRLMQEGIAVGRSSCDGSSAGAKRTNVWYRLLQSDFLQALPERGQFSGGGVTGVSRSWPIADEC